MSVAKRNLKFNSALVTGGAGFIGSHLVEAHVTGGCQVTVLDNPSSGHRENLSACADKITFIEGDIRDERILARAVSGCEVVFHLAAEIFVPRTIEDPIKSAEINTIGTLNVLEAARKSGVQRVVLSSSCAVYGNPAKLPVTETTPTQPLSPYAAQKRNAEQHAAVYSGLYDLETINLRYFNVYGPRQDSPSPYSGVISVFLGRAIKGQVPVIQGDGRQSRDFIYVQDVVVANLTAANQTDLSGEVYNIGTGQQTTIKRLWNTVSQIADVSIDPTYETAREGDVRNSVADTTLAEEKLEFKARTTLEEGLAKTYEWYKDRLKAED